MNYREIKPAYTKDDEQIYVYTNSDGVYVGDNESKTLTNKLNEIDGEINKGLQKIEENSAQLSEIVQEKADKTATNNIQQQINNLVLASDGSQNAEVVQARGNGSVLNDRFISIENGSNIKDNILNNSLNEGEYFIEVSDYDVSGKYLGVNILIRCNVSFDIGDILNLSLDIKSLKTINIRYTGIDIFTRTPTFKGVINNTISGNKLLGGVNYNINGAYTFIESVTNINNIVISFALNGDNHTTSEILNIILNNIKLSKNNNAINTYYNGELYPNKKAKYYSKVGFLNEYLKISKSYNINFDLLKDKNVVVIGDSITEGDYGQDDTHPAGTVNLKEKNYPYFFKKLTKCNLVNLGKSGFNSKSLRPIVRAYDFSNTDIAIIMIGTNNGLGGTYDDLDTYLGAYVGIIKWIEESSKGMCQIFLCQSLPNGIRTPEMMKEVYKNTRLVGKENHIKVIDTNKYLGINSSNFDLYLNAYDKTHPNELGYQKLGEFIALNILKNIECY